MSSSADPYVDRASESIAPAAGAGLSPRPRTSPQPTLDVGCQPRRDDREGVHGHRCRNPSGRPSGAGRRVATPPPLLRQSSPEGALQRRHLMIGQVLRRFLSALARVIS
jgi:hypothetical protein